MNSQRKRRLGELLRAKAYLDESQLDEKGAQAGLEPYDAKVADWKPKLSDTVLDKPEPQYMILKHWPSKPTPDLIEHWEIYYLKD